jgi:MerR family mercuric resistance operon transcriptional regulator
MQGHLTGPRPVGTARLQIGKLARRTGCNIDTIRYYEKIGVLAPPVRTEGGFRVYGGDYLRRLTFIRRARALSFPLDEVRAMLRLSDERAKPCAEVQQIAIGHLSDVRAKIADLRAMEAALETLIDKCGLDVSGACPLMEALADF